MEFRGQEWRGGIVIDTSKNRFAASQGYNYAFDKRNGEFMRWGKTISEDPMWSPLGPEIADIEISTGDCSGGCQFCYKSNNRGRGVHMSVFEYRSLMKKMNPTLTQVALGITDADKHPDFIEILKLTREYGFVPNYTTSGHGLTLGIMKATRDLCGGVSVSVYEHNWDLALKTVLSFLKLGVKQVNIHLMYSKETYAHCKNLIDYISNSRDFGGLNAVVLLALKQKGRGDGYHALSEAAFENLVDTARHNEIPLGFDSCSAPRYYAYAKKNGLEDTLVYAESCESSLFSIYINALGFAYPCSFTEGNVGGTNLHYCESVMTAWESLTFKTFRERLLDGVDDDGCRHCPYFKV